MMIARELVYLGRALQIEARDDGEDRARWKWHRQGLFSNYAGTALYLLPVKRSRKVDIPTGREKGKKLWRAWSTFEVDGAFKMRLDDKKLELHKCGYPVAIVYESDKWTGKTEKYIHEFTGKPAPILYCNRSKNPVHFGILDLAGKRLVTAQGIVG